MAPDPIKDALHMMPYGFYSITSRNSDEVNAMVANWVMQASFEPRLVDGDHELVVGEVVGGGVVKPGKAADSLTLVDLGWSYAG